MNKNKYSRIILNLELLFLCMLQKIDFQGFFDYNFAFHKNIVSLWVLGVIILMMNNKQKILAKWIPCSILERLFTYFLVFTVYITNSK